MKEERDFEEVFDAYLDQENLYRTEGEQGFNNLCMIANALGYKDVMGFGSLPNGAHVGDFMEFLSDNPGAVEAIHEWIRENGEKTDWKEKLETELVDDEDEDEATAV